tara:strand:+ start:832 stop:1365 length:534 start_codon:yes stop_codon:yes gene_type:complete
VKKVFIYTVLIFSVAFVFADVKIGWVDGAQLMYSHEDMRVAQAELEKEQKRVQVDFESKVATLDSLRSEFDKRKMLLDEESLRKMQNNILSLTQELEGYQNKYFGPEGEFYKMQNELLEPIMQEINKAIQNVAIKEGFDYVLDVTTQQGVVYALDSYNITEQVMTELSKMIIDPSEE